MNIFKIAEQNDVNAMKDYITSGGDVNAKNAVTLTPRTMMTAHGFWA